MSGIFGSAHYRRFSFLVGNGLSPTNAKWLYPMQIDAAGDEHRRKRLPAGQTADRHPTPLEQSQERLLPMQARTTASGEGDLEVQEEVDSTSNERDRPAHTTVFSAPGAGICAVVRCIDERP
jgi:hypothetical protein